MIRAPLARGHFIREQKAFTKSYCMNDPPLTYPYTYIKPMIPTCVRYRFFFSSRAGVHVGPARDENPTNP